MKQKRGRNHLISAPLHIVEKKRQQNELLPLNCISVLRWIFFCSSTM